MVTRIKLGLAALLLAGCANQAAQVDPLLDGMGQLKTLFELEQTNTRNLVTSSNPPADVLDKFLDAQSKSYGAFMTVYTAMAGQVASIGQFSTEDTAALMDKIADTIIAIKGSK